MARAALRIYGPALIATGPATVVTVPASTMYVIRYLHVSNPSGSAVTFSLSIGADAAGTRLYQTYSVPAAAAGVTDSVRQIWVYLPMAAAEILTLTAGTNNVLTMTIGGDTLTVG